MLCRVRECWSWGRIVRSVYNNAKWRGNVIRIHPAKESYHSKYGRVGVAGCLCDGELSNRTR